MSRVGSQRHNRKKKIYIYIYIYIYILTTFRLYIIARIGERKKNVYGFLMQFLGYREIWCVFATSLFILWKLVSNSGVGHLQAFVHITKSELDVNGNIDAHSSVTQTAMFHIKNKYLSLMFLHVSTSTRPT